MWQFVTHPLRQFLGRGRVVDTVTRAVHHPPGGAGAAGQRLYNHIQVIACEVPTSPSLDYHRAPGPADCSGCRVLWLIELVKYFASQLPAHEEGVLRVLIVPEFSLARISADLGPYRNSDLLNALERLKASFKAEPSLSNCLVFCGSMLWSLPKDAVVYRTKTCS